MIKSYWAMTGKASDSSRQEFLKELELGHKVGFLLSTKDTVDITICFYKVSFWMTAFAYPKIWY